MQFVNRGVYDELSVLVETQSVGRDITDRKRAKEQLRGYAQRMIALEEELRRKLSAELHDEIGRDLTALGINLAIISSKMSEASRQAVESRIEDSGVLIENITQTVRGVMATLRPPELDDYGLAAALEWYAALQSKRHGIPIKLQSDESFPRLPEEKELVLFRIAQEALANAIRHAEATAIALSLSRGEGSVRLTITDDGCGFSVGSSRQLDSGWGLTIMRERAEAVGARLSVESSSGAGTTVSVELSEE